MKFKEKFKMFKPKLSLGEAEYLFHGFSLNEKELKNTELYNLVREITEKAHPSLKTRFDTKWEGFYLPLRRSGKQVIFPKFQNSLKIRH